MNSMTRRNFAFKAVPVAAAAVALAGCGGTSAITASQIQAWAQTVQTDVRSLCGLVPYVDDVAILIGTFVSAVGVLVTPLNAIARQICAAAGPPAVSSKKRAGRLVPAGVAINGVVVRFE